MSLRKISKQPWEIKDYSLDFAAELQSGETLTLVSVTTLDLATNEDSTSRLVAASPAPAVTGMKVLFWLKDGEAGERHKLTVKVTSSRGQNLEGDLKVNVEEL